MRSVRLVVLDEIPDQLVAKLDSIFEAFPYFDYVAMRNPAALASSDLVFVPIGQTKSFPKRLKALLRSVPEKTPVVFLLANQSQSQRAHLPKELAPHHRVIAFDSYRELSFLVVEVLQEFRARDWISDSFEVRFAPQLNRQQVMGSLKAMANYFRACGGAGFDLDFEEVEVLLKEPVDVLA